MDARALLLKLGHVRRDTSETVLATLESIDPEILVRPGQILGGNGNGSIIRTMGHLVYVEEVWLQELQTGVPVEEAPDPHRYFPVANLAASWRAAGAAWLAEIETMNLNAPFFQNPEHTRSLPNWVIVSNVIHHAAHHIAEVWTALTANGIQPPEINLISWADAHLTRIHEG